MLGFWRFRRFLDRLEDRRLLREAEKAVSAFPMVANRVPTGLPTPLVVSLTSYPPRFPCLAPTLRSLLDQTISPDRLVLWIAGQDMAELPADVLALELHGLEIRSCPDLRSFKKLVPALSLWPEAHIVTADDDVYYPPDWLEGLVSAALRHPGAVAGHRIHRPGRNGSGHLTPYASWELASRAIVAESSADLLFPTGVGGILYPPHSLHPAVLDEALFLRLCPRGDDIWFFWMARLAGTQHVGTGCEFRVVPWRGSQESALYLDNWLAGENDVQVQAMEDHFGPLPFEPAGDSRAA